jgi:hypothetical protein
VVERDAVSTIRVLPPWTAAMGTGAQHFRAGAEGRPGNSKSYILKKAIGRGFPASRCRIQEWRSGNEQQFCQYQSHRETGAERCSVAGSLRFIVIFLLLAGFFTFMAGYFEREQRNSGIRSSFGT